MAIEGTWTFTKQSNSPIPFDLLETRRGLLVLAISSNGQFTTLDLREDSKLRVIATWLEAAKTEDGKKYQLDCFKDSVDFVDLEKSYQNLNGFFDF
uniref:Lipocalin-like domain-containing protein n=1 Tax=Mesocestoides corti TaxID=53468 RepID=A0A5K3FXY7_MESCO